MKTTDYIVFLIAGGLIIGAIVLFSKPRVQTVAPQYKNVEFGIDLARNLGVM